MNPWDMVKVQLGCASKPGAHIGLEMAMKIEATYNDVFVTRNGGKFIFAMKVLLCTNACTNIFFPRNELSYKHLSSLLCLRNWRDRGRVLDMDPIHHSDAC